MNKNHYKAIHAIYEQTSEAKECAGCPEDMLVNSLLTPVSKTIVTALHCHCVKMFPNSFHAKLQ